MNLMYFIVIIFYVINVMDKISKKSTFTAFKNRTFLAVVLTLITSVLMIPAMPTYLPVVQNDAIGIPVLLFPFIWTGLFIYSYMAESVKQVWLVMISLNVIHISCIYFALFSK